MSEQSQLVIVGDPKTGAVQVTGPIDNLILCHWMLGEARRIVERRQTDREHEAAQKVHVPNAREILKLQGRNGA